MGDLRKAFLLFLVLGITSLALGTGEGSAQARILTLSRIPYVTQSLPPHPWLTRSTPAKDMVWVALSGRLFSQNFQTLTAPVLVTEVFFFFLEILS